MYMQAPHESVRGRKYGAEAMIAQDIKKHLIWRFESDLEARVRRTEELRYQRIIGAHYFAAASLECLELYRDGYMLGCIMCSQALLEAILKFVAQRNKINYKQTVEYLIKDIETKNVLHETAINAAKLAWRHRNDFHHLNPGIAAVALEDKAKECIDAILSLEQEIFCASFIEGALNPNNPIYWDIGADGTVPVFVRNLDA